MYTSRKISNKVLVGTGMLCDNAIELLKELQRDTWLPHYNVRERPPLTAPQRGTIIQFRSGTTKTTTMTITTIVSMRPFTPAMHQPSLHSSVAATIPRSETIPVPQHETIRIVEEEIKELYQDIINLLETMP
jgi:hypothetical protein